MTLTIILWSIAALWVFLLWFTRRVFSQVKTLESLGSDLERDPGAWPLVSVLVPARNEEKRVLADSIRAILDQDYPHFEVIAVDDRSTDGTIGILHRFAAEDSRLQVVEGAEPPADWLGKVYALHQAAGRARGEWVLVVDSDVIMNPATVRAAIRLAERRGGDAVAMPICPEWRGRWPQIIIPASAMLTILAFDVRRRRDPSGDPAFVGGAFMLIRREALERIGGFASVKDQLPEGVQLALRLKRQGYRLSMEWIPGLLRTPSYASLKELWRGYQLVAFPALGHRYSVALAVVMMDVLIFIGPSLMALGAVVSLAVGWLRWSPALWPVFIAYAAMVIAYAKVYRLFRVPWVCSFIAFVGHSIMIAILLTSAWAHLLDRGLVWRGRRVSARRESGIR